MERSGPLLLVLARYLINLSDVSSSSEAKSSPEKEHSDLLRKIFWGIVYIEYYNKNQHRDLVSGKGLPDLYLSAVVLMELRIGATFPDEIRDLANLEKVFKKRERIIAPTSRDYWLAAEILVNLRTKHNYDIRSAGIRDDVLIALAARRIGAILITKNQKDFELIRSCRDFHLLVV